MERRGELLDDLALLARQLARDDDVDDRAEVAAAAGPTEDRHALPAQRDGLARLRPGVETDLVRAVERRDADARAERGDGRGHVDHGDEVVAVADEALVLGDVDEHVEVAGRRAGLAGVAVAAQADALAVGDAGRDVDAQRALG